MKRILLITESLGSGGAERQICGLAVMLTRVGYSCRFITYVDNQFYEPYLHDNSVDYELVEGLLPKYTRVFRVAKYVRKYNPDVVISYLPSVNLTMCLARLFCNTHLVVSERNNNIDITLRDIIRFNLYRIADAVVPNSISQSNFIRKNFKFLAEKTIPIINYVDLDRFKALNIAREHESLRIITVARYTQQKNVLTYLKVVRKIKDLGIKIHFDWYGDKEHNPQYYQQVVDEYNRLDISDYLTLHGHIRNIEDEYRRSDVFCLPSLFEGYPNVIVEAMSSLLPIICSNVYENPYIIKDGENGFLFDPENVDDIVSTILRVTALSDKERHRMGVINRQRCLDYNTEEVFIKQYVELIERL